MTELGASHSMVFAVRIASRLNMTVDEVFGMPLAKAIAIDNAFQVIDGIKSPTVTITEEDKKIVNFLSENQEEILERFKNMGRFTQ